MTRMRRCVLSTVLSFAFAAVVASGQEPGPPPGGMPFLRFGGMGGMMGGGPQGGDLQLLTNASVQKDVNITAKQKGQLRSVQESANASRLEIFAAAREQGFDPQAIGEQMTAIAKDQESKVGRILEKKQKTRLDQIKLQRDGLIAASRSEVASKLKLNASQTKQVKKIVDSMNKEIASAMPAPPGGFGGPPGGFPGGGDTPKKKVAIRQAGGDGDNGNGNGDPNGPPGFGGPGGPPGGPDFEAFREAMQKGFEAMRKARESASKQIEAVLTDDQKAAWAKLTGEPFDLSTLQQGPGGPGGPGGPREKGATKPAKKDTGDQ